jgi:arylsulfatase A-like enzyme
MAGNGLRLTRFYAAAPVCSPTRGSCLTGRHPERYGIYFANEGFLKKEEVSLAEVVKTKGYATGHFGKWHLGTLTQKIKDGRRGGPANPTYFSPPWENGFDVSFSTEQAVPTWDPMKNQSFLTKYWTGSDVYETENLEGDDSRVIVDRVLPFIENSAQKQQPFFAVAWFHTPHEPVVAGPEYLKLYKQFDENKQHYYGTITAMDEQIGRLREKLRSLKIDKNTIVFFASDNGPAGKGGGIAQEPGGRQQGIAGPYRGRKGSLYEGGIRVPGIVEWPGTIKKGSTSDFPTTTSDYFPTLASLLGYVNTDKKVIDGEDVSALFHGKSVKRGGFIGFKSLKQRALMDGNFKIYSNDDGQSYEMYDLLKDPSETNNIAANYPAEMKTRIAKLDKWIESCRSGE